VRAAVARAGANRPIETEIARAYIGSTGKPQRYTIVIVPPRR